MPTAAPLAIDARSLRRSYAQRGRTPRLALDGIDLRLPAGGVHGLLGPNGAGKTTLCRIASTVLLPTSGGLRVLGHDVVSEAAVVRTTMSVVFGGERGLYTRLSARDNLRFWCAMHGLPARAGRQRADALLERVGLADRGGDRVESFSRGMKQRLHLARGLVGDARVLLLDEPTAGMDPVAAHEFRALVLELREEGRTLLLTTHDMAEAQAVCDTITCIDHGRVVAEGTPATLTAALPDVRIVVEQVPDGTEARLEQLGLEVGASTAHASVARECVASMVAAITALGITELRVQPPTLEEAYLRIVGSDRGIGVAS